MKGKSKKWGIFEVIGKPYALPVLESLAKNPKRYSDLGGSCYIDKTRTKRLRELEEEGLIKTITKKEPKGRTFVYYALTEQGKKIMHQVLKFI